MKNFMMPARKSIWFAPEIGTLNSERDSDSGEVLLRSVWPTVTGHSSDPFEQFAVFSAAIRHYKATLLRISRAFRCKLVGYRFQQPEPRSEFQLGSSDEAGRIFLCVVQERPCVLAGSTRPHGVHRRPRLVPDRHGKAGMGAVRLGAGPGRHDQDHFKAFCARSATEITRHSAEPRDFASRFSCGKDKARAERLRAQALLLISNTDSSWQCRTSRPNRLLKYPGW